MSNDINTITINGRLTKDREERATQSGTTITRFSLANGYSRKEGDQWKDETNFFDCVMIGKNGLSQYLLKGKQVSIQGELRQQRWEDNNGDKRSKIEILVRNIQLMGDSKSGGSSRNDVPDGAYDGAPQTRGAQQSQSSQEGADNRFDNDFPDSDIPF